MNLFDKLIHSWNLTTAVHHNQKEIGNWSATYTYTNNMFVNSSELCIEAGLTPKRKTQSSFSEHVHIRANLQSESKFGPLHIQVHMTVFSALRLLSCVGYSFDLHRLLLVRQGKPWCLVNYTTSQVLLRLLLLCGHCSVRSIFERLHSKIYRPCNVVHVSTCCFDQEWGVIAVIRSWSWRLHS